MADYCDRDNIEDLFGPKNVEKWADLDNDANAAAIAARIARAIVVASAQIDDRLRNGPYVLPFSSTPTLITDLAASLAGVWLYESRGVQDFDEASGVPMHRLRWHRERAERTLKDLRSGVLQLDATRVGYGQVAPIVVNE